MHRTIQKLNDVTRSFPSFSLYARALCSSKWQLYCDYIQKYIKIELKRRKDIVTLPLSLSHPYFLIFSDLLSSLNECRYSKLELASATYKQLHTAWFKIDHVNDRTKMNGTDVRADVGRFLRTILAMRTFEPRQLTALVLEMLLQVVLPVENAAAIWTGKPDVANVLHSEGRGSISFIH